MAFSIKRRANISPMKVIGRLATVAIALWVGQILLDAVKSAIGTTTINNESGYFYQAYKFLGFNAASTGIIVVVGVISVAYIALEFVEIKM
jgi:hypothetical protein